MPQQDTPIALCGKQINALFGDSVADEDKIVSVLEAESDHSPGLARKLIGIDGHPVMPPALPGHPVAVDTYSFAKVDKIASNTSTSTG